MSTGGPEFSRLVPLARLGKEPLRQEIVANADERAALARRLDLVALDRLSAVVELTRQPDRTILLSASFTAELAQSCVVTFEPVAGAVEESFMLRYGPPEWEQQGGAAEDEAAFEPLSGDAIDIGEAVAQELVLSLPPFPRVPGASVEAEIGPAADPGPFAALGRLAGRREP